MINEEILKGKWNEIRGEIRSRWGKLTDDELESAKGDSTRLMGLIQQRYGSKKEEVEGALEKMVSRFSGRVDEFRKNRPDESENTLNP